MTNPPVPKSKRRGKVARLLCGIGLHGPMRGRLGTTPGTTYKWCCSCGASWMGTYDGIEPGWRRRR